MYHQQCIWRRKRRKGRKEGRSKQKEKAIASSSWESVWIWLQQIRAALCCGVWASRCSSLSCCRAWTLGTRASVVAAHGLSTCGIQAYLLHGLWYLPGPRIKPVSPALTGGFSTLGDQGSPWTFHTYFQKGIFQKETLKGVVFIVTKGWRNFY